MDDLRLNGDPLSGVVLVVDANLVDVREFDRLLRHVRNLAPALVDHRSDDAVGDAGSLQRHERISIGEVIAGLRVDGLDDEVVAQSGLRHLHHGPVVHRWRFRRSQRAVDCLRSLVRMGLLCDRD